MEDVAKGEDYAIKLARGSCRGFFDGCIAARRFAVKMHIAKMHSMMGPWKAPFRTFQRFFASVSHVNVHTV